MKEQTLTINGFVNAGCAATLEAGLRRLPGVHLAAANYLNGTATVRYDEQQISLAQLQAAVGDCGYACQGEAAPEHMSRAGHDHAGRVQPTPPTVDHTRMDHGAHAGPAPEIMQPQPDHTGHAQHTPTADHAAMGHAGHAGMSAVEDHSAHGGHAGMTAADMERDMRNRFFVSLVLTVPVFLFSHLATEILSLRLPLPFGLSDQLFGFLLTTPVVLYGAWPFYLGARNGLRQGVLNMSVLVALSGLTGYLFSVAATFLFAGEVFYEAAAWSPTALQAWTRA